jgi:hypothetical protein
MPCVLRRGVWRLLRSPRLPLTAVPHATSLRQETLPPARAGRPARLCGLRERGAWHTRIMVGVFTDNIRLHADWARGAVRLVVEAAAHYL